jgi:hypothetical protein
MEFGNSERERKSRSEGLLGKNWETCRGRKNEWIKEEEPYRRNYHVNVIEWSAFWYCSLK